MSASLSFIPHCLPSVAKAPPGGLSWLHQPKLDGYRLQAVKEGRTVRLYTRTECLARPGGRAEGYSDAIAIIDGELVMVVGIVQAVRLVGCHGYWS